MGKMPIKQKEYDRMKEDIYKRGIQVPLVITPDKRLLCGYNRWSIAKELNMKKVPVIVKKVSENKLYEFAVKDNIMRRQLSLEDVAAYIEQESTQEKGRPKKHSREKTNADLAKTLGVSRATISKAKSFTKKVKNMPTLKGKSIREVLESGEPVIRKVLKFEVTIGVDEEKLMKEVENIIDELYDFNPSNGDKIKTVVQLFHIKRK
jgi:ParB-like chromosome segregation protein Spo0J